MLHLGYEVWICNKKKDRLFEYEVSLEEDTTMVCYIPSENGKVSVATKSKQLLKEFQIRWKDHDGSHHTRMRTLVDGNPAGRTYCRPGASGKRLGISTSASNTYQVFQFVDLQTTDDDDALLSASTSDKLGSIELHVYHVHAQAKESRFKPASFAGIGTVHERSKKAGAHCVELGRVLNRKSNYNRVKSKLLDKHAGPFAKFVFRYRPAAILEAQGIMPKIATHPSISKARARVASPLDDKKPMKFEPGAGTGIAGGDVIELTSDDESKPAVKFEARHQTKRRYDSDDIIDLTLD